MSDENSFATVATQAPPEPPVEEAAGRSSKALLIAGGVAVIVLAVFAYLLFFGSGGSDSADQGTVPKPVVLGGQPAQDSTNGSKDTTKSNGQSGTKSANVEGRNPFVPLEVDTPTTDTTTGTTTDSTTPPTTAGPSVTVNLLTVGKSSVTASVDGKTYKGLAEGETFATNFQVYAIFNDSCAGFLYGDSSFALCEGKSVTLTQPTG